MNIENRGRIRMSTWLGALFVAVCVLGAGQVEARKMPKVGICHFDEDTGLFHLINVSMNAQAAHLAHGDGLPEEDNAAIGIVFDAECNIEPSAPEVLAHAFIDIGDNDRFYNPITDFSIALLEDTDGSGNVSIGDEIKLSSYPLNFDPQDASDLGTWTATDHVVAGIEADTLSEVTVFTMTPAAGVHILQWISPPDIAGDKFQDVDFPGSVTTIEDSSVTESINVFTQTPGGPDIPVSLSLSSNATDDRFIQVVIP